MTLKPIVSISVLSIHLHEFVAMIVQGSNLKHIFIFILAKHETIHETRNFIWTFELEGLRLSA